MFVTVKQNDHTVIRGFDIIHESRRSQQRSRSGSGFDRNTSCFLLSDTVRVPSLSGSKGIVPPAAHICNGNIWMLLLAARKKYLPRRFRFAANDCINRMNEAGECRTAEVSRGGTDGSAWEKGVP